MDPLLRRTGHGKRGRFVVFEGGEATGKSTHVAHVGAARSSVVVTFEPGATTLGVELRRLLLDATATTLAPIAEALLMAADRAQHVAETIRPALSTGVDVVCDRYIGSSLAYQGYGRGLDLGTIRRLSEIATDGLRADVIVLLDMDPAEARRRGPHGGDRFEDMDIEFHRRVRNGFLCLAAADRKRWAVVDASKPMDAVRSDVAAVLQARLAWNV